MNENLLIEVLGIMKTRRSVLESFPVIVGLTTSQPTITIGSEPQTPPSLVFKQAGVSRRQARIFFLNDIWYVEDRGSDNGTWIISGGEPIFAKMGDPLAVTDSALVLFGVVVARLTILK